MTDDPLLQIERSWTANAAAWTSAVRERRIESRRLATDGAILEAVLACGPRRVLDLGCGEGWLARALAERGVDAVGVDASAPLVEEARAVGGVFHVLSYDDLGTPAADVLGAPFDVVSANFSLLGDPLDDVLRAARRLMSPEGFLVVQTAHPWTARGDEPYADGWRVERFAGFGEGFAEPMPWYFRTLASWVGLIRGAGLHLTSVREPVHPESGIPLSLLLTAAASPRSGG
ncbi:MAG TPA: class I SAM-dependent methyltransferase [Longimicrobium sp.]|jgi:SAM-dependent methyltransferase